jgi:L-ascorbate metabolism protein UlaG (beta-lactamase superfamily)
MHERDKHIEDGHISQEDIEAFERVYVFASHAHHDHFNTCIFDWASPRVTYILDSTIKNVPDGVVTLSPGETYSDETLFVREFGSTDSGGSFYVNVGGTSLFHAGDLNDWHWKDEGNARYSRIMTKMFDREMVYLQKHVAHIDYAFFPVDKRMGTGHDAGAKKFIEMIKPDVMIPIHFQSFSDTAEFREAVAGCGTNVLGVTHNGERLV